MKKKEILYYIPILLLLLILGLTCVNLVYMKNIPKKYCRTETKIEKIELSAKYDNHGWYISGSSCKEYDGEILCEDGVDLYPSMKKACNWGDGIKVCLMEKTERICEYD